MFSNSKKFSILIYKGKINCYKLKKINFYKEDK